VGEDTLTLEITDGVIGSATKSITISLEVRNTAPVAQDLQFRIKAEETLNFSAEEGLLTQAFDVDGDDLEIHADSVGTHQLAHGTLTIAADGSFQFTPKSTPSEAAGRTEFEFKVTDGAEDTTATLTIDVTTVKLQIAGGTYGVNRGDGTVSESGTGHKTQLRKAFDPNGGSDPTYQLVGDQPTEGTLSISLGGEVTFTPNDPNFTGQVGFQYQVANEYGTSDTVSGTLEVKNEAVQATDDRFTIKHGTPLTFTAEDLLSNDFDADGDELTVQVNLGSASGGVLTENTGGTETGWHFPPTRACSATRS